MYLRLNVLHGTDVAGTDTVGPGIGCTAGLSDPF